MSDLYVLPEDCGYNKIFKYNWITPVYGLSINHIPNIDNICKKRWGWHFKPKPDMNYLEEKWFEKQNMVLSFESKIDLIICKLSIDVTK